MQDYKTIIGVIVIFYGPGYLAPVRRVHVTAVDGRIKLDVVDVEVEHLDFWHIVDEMSEIKRLEHPGLGVLYHAYGAACIDNQDASAWSVFYHCFRFMLLLF